MKVLLDECVDWRLARDLSDYDVKTVRQMGWSGFKNGELLSLAAKQFDVFVILDNNLPHQQNVDQNTIAVLILKPRTSRLVDLRSLVPGLKKALSGTKSGTVEFISCA